MPKDVAPSHEDVQTGGAVSANGGAHAPVAHAPDPGWTNRLFVARAGWWRGSFPLSGDVYWNPQDVAAPYALIFDPSHWTPITVVRAPAFRGWRYLDAPPSVEAALSAVRLDGPQQKEPPPRTS